MMQEEPEWERQWEYDVPMAAREGPTRTWIGRINKFVEGLTAPEMMRGEVQWDPRKQKPKPGFHWGVEFEPVHSTKGSLV